MSAAAHITRGIVGTATTSDRRTTSPYPSLLTSMSLAPSDALRRWQSAQGRLANVIQEYADACTVLENSLEQGDPDEDTISTFDTLLPGLSRHEDALRTARLGLVKTRNPSHAMTPIHKLHPDILMTIFTLASQEWISMDFEELDDEPVSATTLASVCSLWRQLLLQAPVFWSNIDIVLTGPMSERDYERAQAWAERAQSAPLWLTIQDVLVDEEDIEREPREQVLPDSVITRILDFSTPLMPFVRTLAIHIEDSIPTALVHALLGCWIRHHSPGVAERLELHIDFGVPEMDMGIPVISPVSQSSDLHSDEVAPFLKSLRGVYLENVDIDFRHVPYSGLTDLHIEFSNQTGWLPAQQDLARLFKANPGLRSLTLENMTLGPGGRVTTPVPLDFLQKLRLEALDDGDLGRVLALISSSSPALRMAVTIGDGNHLGCVAEAQAFFSRTRVTVLFVDSGLGPEEPDSPITALFAHMPYLHTLTLQSCNLSVSGLNDFAEWCSSQNGSVNPWPALRKLNLFQCDTTPEIVRRITQVQNIQTLGLFEPQMWSVMPVWNSGWANTNVRTVVEQELLQRGIKMIWYSPSGQDLPSWTFVD
ncbi:F-box-like domain-containing protein [Ceratobasidium sp. AG-Ba]|nr:F-box-like domain-containing protein [Ceratobasidium sp. AG-Ba]